MFGSRITVFIQFLLESSLWQASIGCIYNVMVFRDYMLFLINHLKWRLFKICLNVTPTKHSEDVIFTQPMVIKRQEKNLLLQESRFPSAFLVPKAFYFSDGSFFFLFFFLMQKGNKGKCCQIYLYTALIFLLSDEIGFGERRKKKKASTWLPFMNTPSLLLPPTPPHPHTPSTHTLFSLMASVLISQGNHLTDIALEEEACASQLRAMVG